MFLDTHLWPPSPDGFDPQPPREPRLNAAQERLLMRVIGVLLFALFLGPFAGSSVVDAIVALLG